MEIFFVESHMARVCIKTVTPSSHNISDGYPLLRSNRLVNTSQLKIFIFSVYICLPLQRQTLSWRLLFFSNILIHDGASQQHTRAHADRWRWTNATRRRRQRFHAAPEPRRNRKSSLRQFAAGRALSCRRVVPGRGWQCLRSGWTHCENSSAGGGVEVRRLDPTAADDDVARRDFFFFFLVFFLSIFFCFFFAPFCFVDFFSRGTRVRPPPPPLSLLLINLFFHTGNESLPIFLFPFSP